MNALKDQGRLGHLVLVISTLSIFADQVFSNFISWEKYLVGLNPIVVFLDIPVPLPFTIALLPFFIFFILFYRIATSQERIKGDESLKWMARYRLRKIIPSLLILPVCMIFAGIFYGLVRDFLPGRLQNGLESFGVNEDLYLPFPDLGVIHFRGSMVIMGACWLGYNRLKKRIRSIENRNPPKPVGTPGRPVAGEKNEFGASAIKKKEQPEEAIELVR